MIVFSFLLIGGSAPKPPEFNALKQKNEGISVEVGGRALPLPPPSFLCPTQALGFALQHHPILLLGAIILRLSRVFADYTLKTETTFLKILSTIQKNLSLTSLNHCPVHGVHFRGVSEGSVGLEVEESGFDILKEGDGEPTLLVVIVGQQAVGRGDDEIFKGREGVNIVDGDGHIVDRSNGEGCIDRDGVEEAVGENELDGVQALLIGSGGVSEGPVGGEGQVSQFGLGEEGDGE